MPDISKSKLQIHNSKQVSTRLGSGASTSGSTPAATPPSSSPLMQIAKAKKDYSKDKQISNANFGQTGLTGES
jgi:hypothetical protein